jgi:protease-4
MLFSLLFNLFRAAWLLLTLPLRLLQKQRGPLYVRFILGGDLPHRASMKTKRIRLFRPKPKGRVKSLDELATQLAHLAKDARVRGILLKFDDLQMNAARRALLSEMLAQFKKSGKRVVAFAVTASTPEYEVMCSADVIYLPKPGQIQLVGYAAEATALGGALEQLGVKPHFVRRGDYKTAPELYTRKEISPIQRMTLEGILDERYQNLLSQMAQGRHLSMEEAAMRVDAGPYSASRALEQKLCDGLCAEVALPQLLLGGTEEEAKKQMVDFGGYLSSQAWPAYGWKPLSQKPRVALVMVEGAILPGAGGGRIPWGPKVAGADAVVAAIRKAEQDKRSKAILLYIKSPGGSAMASELILEALQRADQKKPVLAYFDEVAASGGYMVAVGAREIWAAPSAIAGSIGVFGGKFSTGPLLERIGIYREVLQRGAHAGMFSLSRPFSAAEEAALEREIDETYQTFLGHVSSARKMSVEQVHERAEGRIFSGRRAVELGLVDKTGTLDEACRGALKLAGITAEDFSLRRVKVSIGAAGMDPLASLLTARTYAVWPDGLWPRLLAGVGLCLTLFLQPGCQTTGHATKSPEAISSSGPEEALGRFLSYAQQGDFEGAYGLMASKWRQAYTPEQLASDYRRDPAAEDRLRRAQMALLQRRFVHEGEMAKLPVGGEKAVWMVREGGSYFVWALE